METGTGPAHQEQGSSELQQSHRGALAPPQLSALSEKVMSKLKKKKIRVKKEETIPKQK